MIEYKNFLILILCTLFLIKFNNGKEFEFEDMDFELDTDAEKQIRDAKKELQERAEDIDFFGKDFETVLKDKDEKDEKEDKDDKEETDKEEIEKEDTEKDNKEKEEPFKSKKIPEEPVEKEEGSFRENVEKDEEKDESGEKEPTERDDDKDDMDFSMEEEKFQVKREGNDMDFDEIDKIGNYERLKYSFYLSKFQEANSKKNPNNLKKNSTKCTDPEKCKLSINKNSTSENDFIKENSSKKEISNTSSKNNKHKQIDNKKINKNVLKANTKKPTKIKNLAINFRQASRSKPRNKYENKHYQATSLKPNHYDINDSKELTKKPLECECTVKVQPKIIGGSDSSKGKYPFAAAIFTLVGRGSFCGATIINEYYLLTAAHCVQRHFRIPRNYNIVAGRTDLNISDLKEEFITKATHIWLNGRANDVAVVKLAEPFIFNSQIKPACFGGPSIVPKEYSSGYNKYGFDVNHFNNLENVSKHFKKTNRTLTAIGWGYIGWKVIKQNGVSKIKPMMTTKLQEVELNEVICAKEDYLICVEGKGKSPCFGDSGSPLLYSHFEKQLVVGLTSRSSSNKARHCLGAPTIYERSSYYLPWIKTLTSHRICLVD